jgi:hypothetical protein
MISLEPVFTVRSVYGRVQAFLEGMMREKAVKCGDSQFVLIY